MMGTPNVAESANNAQQEDFPNSGPERIQGQLREQLEAAQHDPERAWLRMVDGRWDIDYGAVARIVADCGGESAGKVYFRNLWTKAVEENERLNKVIDEWIKTTEKVVKAAWEHVEIRGMCSCRTCSLAQALQEYEGVR